MATLYNPIKSYPYSANRLLVIDWASLSYHQWHALVHHKGDKPIETSDDECEVWRSHMFNKVMKYVRLFNPLDVIFALEGKNVWRKELVKEYYSENTLVYYDASAYYVRFDNFFFKVYKDGDEFKIQKLDFIADAHLMTNKCKKLKELPQRVQDMLWELYLPNGKTPLLPKYKGTRDKQEWKFFTDKMFFKEYKEEFAKELAGLYRAKCIQMEGAEGDDAVYVSLKYLEPKYDSIILITRDSDFNQLLDQKNLKIYNHQTDNMTSCLNPQDYLEIKILAGDDSDNIQGIALPEKKNQLGGDLVKGTAKKLYEANRNVYDKAKLEGWDNQYRRNQTLISLKYIPTHIQRTLCETIDANVPELKGIEDISHLGIKDKLLSNVMKMKNLGFYTLLDREYVASHPDIFNSSLIKHEDDEQMAVAEKPKRTFGNLNNVFDNPLDESECF